MRTLVTGGAGFIGGHLVRRLVADGHEVTVIDDLSSGSAAGLPPGVELRRLDVADPATTDAVADVRPELVVHAAAQVSVVRSEEDPARDHEVNVAGTRHVVDGARRGGARRLVFLSSGGAIYGEADGARETDPARPLSAYGRNKLAAEELVSAAGISHANARLANVYGPGQRADLEGGVIAIFCGAARSGAPVTIYGDGEQRRDFVHVDDVVDAILALGVDGRSGTWNVATGESVSVLELLRRVEEVAGGRIAATHAPPRPGEVRHSRLDPARLEADLGWRPRISLTDGLRRLVA